MDEPVLIDVRGLRCPLPVLKTARRMRAHPAGTRFVVLATDPLAAIDVPHFCRESGHRLLARKSRRRRIGFEIEKGAAAPATAARLVERMRAARGGFADRLGGGRRSPFAPVAGSVGVQHRARARLGAPSRRAADAAAARRSRLAAVSAGTMAETWTGGPRSIGACVRCDTGPRVVALARHPRRRRVTRFGPQT